MTDHSIFTGSGPGSDAGDPASPIILGHLFEVAATGWVKAIRWWRAATSIGGVQKGRVFAVGSETIVSGTAVDFPAPSGTGWQVATLPTPVQLTANTPYKVCVHFTDNYSATGGYWAAGAGVGGITDGFLTAPDAGGNPLGLGGIQQGSFTVTSDPDTYPSHYFNGGNYWVDLVVTDVDPNAGQTIILGLPVGTDSALPVTIAKTTGLGLPVEADSALSLSLGKTAVMGLAVEDSAALAVSLAKTAAMGLATETATALAVAVTKQMLLGLPAEVDSALGIGLLETVRLGLPVSVDLALPLLLNDVWPPSTQPATIRRWATGGPPVAYRWATGGPPSVNAG